MIKLALERINAKSPYEVKEAGGGCHHRGKPQSLFEGCYRRV